jgi:peptidoglycan/xylan/chitin deacetylase (PgdA/CDA1 family)
MIVKNLVSKVRRRIEAANWKRRHRDYLAIFNFHQVTPSFRASVDAAGTWTSLDEFEKELLFVAAHFRILGLTDALNRLRQGELRGACAALTFDDGDVSLAQYCLAVLEKYSIPATFFINSAGYFGNGHYWFTILNYLQHGPTPAVREVRAAELSHKNQILRTTTDPRLYQSLREEVERLGDQFGVPPRKCVSREWLASLNDELFAIGAHGHEHERYAMMPESWQFTDLERNLEFLREFKAFRPLFAFPFGRATDFNDATLRAAAANQVTLLGADGGINVMLEAIVRRLPADSRSLAAVTRHAMLAR